MRGPTEDEIKAVTLRALEQVRQGRVVPKDEVLAFLDAWERELLQMGAEVFADIRGAADEGLGHG